MKIIWGVAEKGIEFNLSYSDVGDKLEDGVGWGNLVLLKDFKLWNQNNTTKKGKTKWYRVGYFIPKKI